jgi:multidrug efflux pump
MMLTDLFIKRPVLSIVISIAIFLVGAFALTHLGIRQYPLVSADQITVSTSYPGADAQTMAGFVSQPIEAAISTVDGVHYMTASNTKGTSEITCVLKLGVDANAALTDITSNVSSVLWRLPKDIQTPVISKENVSDGPIYFFALGSDTLSIEQITDFAERVVRPQLETVQGLQGVMLFGSRTYAMRIWLDPFKMAAHHITAQDITQALHANNVQTAAGIIESQDQEYPITANTDLHTPQEFENIIIKRFNNNALIRIKDIGRAELSHANDDFNTAFRTFKHSIIVGIVPTSIASSIAVGKDVENLLNTSIKRQMPSNLHFTVLFNTGKFVEDSIHEIIHTFIESILLVSLVIFLFLGSLRATFIPCISIPLSIIGSGSLMYLFGYSINTLTMLAWVIAIGLVVDDSIVVLENIHRHIESGMSRLAASLKGAAEIRFAVIAMTCTLAAVFAPIGFTGGVTGALFEEFAFTMAMTVIISGVIALTLSPMLCSKIMASDKQSETRFEHYLEHLSEKVRIRYEYMLSRVLHFRHHILIGIAFLFLAIYQLFHIIPSELSPPDYEGVVLAIAIGPTAANGDYMLKKIKEMGDTFKDNPAVESYGLVTGYPAGKQSGIAFLMLTPPDTRKQTDPQIIAEIGQKLQGVSGVFAFAMNRPSLPGASGLQPVSFVLQSTGDYPELAKTTNALLGTTYQPGSPIMAARSNLKLDKPQMDIIIDKNKALQYGIDMENISSTLGVLFGKPILNFFSKNGRSYPVVPQVEREFRFTPEQLTQIFLKTSSGEFVSLDNFAQVKQTVTPQSLNHFQQFNAATIEGNLAPGKTLGDAVNFLEANAKKIMPENTSYSFSGVMREYVENNRAIVQAFIFSLIFIFLMLAAQYESFRDPLIILISVPTSIFGALVFIYLSGSTLNIYTKIGLITLIGLISKHGILIVTVANQLRHEENKSIIEAITHAAGIRLRPVLMTTAAMILGVIPLVLTNGSGSLVRHQLGWTLIGGMLIGTMMTLFVVPTLYTYLTHKQIHAIE